MPEATCNTMRVMEIVVVSTVSVVEEMNDNIEFADSVSPGHKKVAIADPSETATEVSV